MKCSSNKLQVESLSQKDPMNDENRLKCSKQMRGDSQIWSVKSKVSHTAVPCLAAFLSTFGASVLEPAVTDVMADFCVGRTQATLCITLYTLGLATGPLVLAPISEAYGRRWVYIPAISFVLAFSAGAAAAKSFAILLTCRFFSGFFCSVGIAVGGGTVADIWPRGKQRATASLLFVLAPFLALTLGPTAGAYVLHIRHANWRWTKWMMVFFCLPLWLMLVLMRETSEEQPPHDANNGWEEIRLYFSSLQHVLMLDYGFGTRQASLGLLSLIVGNFCAIILWVVLEKAVTSSEEKLPGKVFQPEKRLYAGVIGGLLMCLAEIWFALAGRPGGSWVNLVATGIPLGCGAFALFALLLPPSHQPIT
ncbi:MFS polyamine transporter [Aspergillus fumigatus]|nr:MFS polyamine transporter [Aspergillus fumigatus]